MPLVIFVRDDGSEDGTSDILLEMAAAHPEIVLTNVNEGGSGTDSRNIGYVASYFELLKIAAADPEVGYVSLSDQDDIWLPDKLPSALAVLQAAEIAAGTDEKPFLYGCTSILAGQNMRRLGGITQEDRAGVGCFNVMIQNILLGHNQVMNRALLSCLVGRMPDLSRIYAHDLWITETASVVGTIFFDNTPHTLYRQHRQNELGFGIGPVTWLMMRVKRAFGGEIEEILRQRNYFLSFYNREVPASLRREMVRYMRARRTFSSRVVYALRSRLYRQKRFETVLFRILYIAGIYH